MSGASIKPTVAIACGGTGGHLFPGRAVADELLLRGCAVTLLISPKEVGQQAARTVVGMEVVTLPAVGLAWARLGDFARGSWKSFRVARQLFRQRPHQAVLAMGGFTSAPPVLAGKLTGAATFLHESNTVPGRANRWLARVVNRAFVAFPPAARRLRGAAVEVTGTPVRPEFQPGNTSAARRALGLEADRPVLLLMGGSQGASGINGLLLGSLASLHHEVPELQFLHLTGTKDFEKVRAAYSGQGLPAVVRPYLTEMGLALSAATLAVSRAGGSSMAELAAMRLPSILIPYPFAADDHQFHNARAFVEEGAARMLVQKDTTPESFARMVVDLMRDDARRESMRRALARWHKPRVAARIAEIILQQSAAAQARQPLRSTRTSGAEASGPAASENHRAPMGAADVSGRDQTRARCLQPETSPLKSCL
jgi:UDP-N-acetylglucosamine--N-acetylmuramyl-(pentapeptide) pyrophosphoryl-undecaprenol N-acetylglucosamine transferase